MKALKFGIDTLAKPPSHKSKLLDSFTTLQHYCQVNYAVDPAKLSAIIPPRFQATVIPIDGRHKAIISAVVFREKDFCLSSCKDYSFVPKFTFSQTNYRCYVVDTQTGKRTVWFFGTSLDHWSIVVPRYAWRFPWHAAKISFNTMTEQCSAGSIPYDHYTTYHMHADSSWAPASIHVTDSGRETTNEDFPGFPDKETALIYLTHPMSGHFHLRDSTRLGCWEIFHVPMNPRLAHFADGKTNGRRSYFGLFERMGLVEPEQPPYNILLQNTIDYDIYLPPIESIAKDSRYETS